LGRAKGMIEFSRPFGDEVKPRPTTPKGTGYVRGLNLIHSLPPERSANFETVAMGKVDTSAAVALQKLLSASPTPWEPELRRAWSVFLVSILLRNPETLHRIISIMETGSGEGTEESRKLFDLYKRPDETTFEDFLKREGRHAGFLTILKIMNTQIAQHMDTMLWSVINLARARQRLMTSDRPLVMRDGLGQPTCYLIIPISPTKIFVAVNERRVLQNIQCLSHDELSDSVNFTVVSNAFRYVWDTDDSRLQFVQDNMSRTAIDDYVLVSNLGNTPAAA
jgi:uncharacterized protein DUF4238